ncbi:MAG: hypothetical protein FWF32_03470 [Endomicrobia bacterium]|nr:hypothetical protein [Endomicrobiia bacterium]
MAFIIPFTSSCSSTKSGARVYNTGYTDLSKKPDLSIRDNKQNKEEYEFSAVLTKETAADKYDYDASKYLLDSSKKSKKSAAYYDEDDYDSAKEIRYRKIREENLKSQKRADKEKKANLKYSKTAKKQKTKRDLAAAKKKKANVKTAKKPVYPSRQNQQTQNKQQLQAKKKADFQSLKTAKKGKSDDDFDAAAYLLEYEQKNKENYYAKPTKHSEKDFDAAAYLLGQQNKKRP